MYKQSLQSLKEVLTISGMYNYVTIATVSTGIKPFMYTYDIININVHLI